MKLWTLLRRARERRGFTQQEVGLKMFRRKKSSAQVMISRYESGHSLPSAKRLAQMARILRIKPKALGMALIQTR